MKPYKQLFYEYRVLYRPYVNQLNVLLSSFHLTSPLWLIMYFIYREGAQTISDIAHYQNVEKPTTTKMVQKLTELGYVEIRPGNDKRVKIVQLSENGLKVYKEVQDKIDHFQEYLLEDVSEEDRLKVARILRDINRKIDTYKG